MRLRILTVLAAVVALLAVAAPAEAIKNGVPDAGAHPYVGQLLFFDPTAADPRFTDPGGWFNCTGTLVSPTIVVTAGHCTFPEGTNGEPTPGNTGGNDVWINFTEVPDYSILPPSATFAPDNNEGRYDAWSTALNASTEWIRGTAFPHPDYDDNQFFPHDLGVVRLQRAGVPARSTASCRRSACSTSCTRRTSSSSTRPSATAWRARARRPRSAATPGAGPTCGWSTSTASAGSAGGSRRSSPTTPHTGGTCFGDSGGPIFVAGTKSSPRSTRTRRARPAPARPVRTASTRPTTWRSSPPSASRPEWGTGAARSRAGRPRGPAAAGHRRRRPPGGRGADRLAPAGARPRRGRGSATGRSACCRGRRRAVVHRHGDHLATRADLGRAAGDVGLGGGRRLVGQVEAGPQRLRP